MDAFMQLLLLILCASALSEPLNEAMHRRRGRDTIYANDYTQNYEPYVFAAFPLHPPLPVVHVISHAPLTPPKDVRYASSVRHSAYTEPTYAYDYDSDYSEPRQYSHRQPQSHATALPLHAYPSPLPTQESAPTILYARPNSYGGYTYNKRPLQKRAPNRVPPKEESPVILRVHKVRVIRSR